MSEAVTRENSLYLVRMILPEQHLTLHGRVTMVTAENTFYYWKHRFYNVRPWRCTLHYHYGNVPHLQDRNAHEPIFSGETVVFHAKMQLVTLEIFDGADRTVWRQKTKKFNQSLSKKKKTRTYIFTCTFCD